MENAIDIFMYLLGMAIVVGLIVFSIAAVWRLYEKAGKPGWASLIPIYNIVVLNQIAGRPGWWLILYFIPIVNIAISIIVAIDIAKAFGRSTVFGVFGLFLFSIIGYAIIAFGDDTYSPPLHS